MTTDLPRLYEQYDVAVLLIAGPTQLCELFCNVRWIVHQDIRWQPGPWTEICHRGGCYTRYTGIAFLIITVLDINYMSITKPTNNVMKILKSYNKTRYCSIPSSKTAKRGLIFFISFCWLTPITPWLRAYWQRFDMCSV